jgi:hypothetical protein
MDLLSSHKTGRVRDLIEGARLRVRGIHTNVRMVLQLGLSDQEHVESTLLLILK